MITYKKAISKIKCIICKGHFKKARQLVEAAVCFLQAAAFSKAIDLDNGYNITLHIPLYLFHLENDKKGF